MASWGNYPNIPNQTERVLRWTDEPDLFTQRPALPFGQGRSYGDSCQIENGTLLCTKALNHLISFDPDKGTLTCEGGTTLHDILRIITPTGWTLPVVPGTQFVSVGGAIANDIHGKNHHRAGTFGCHVKGFRLRRSDGKTHECSATKNSALFAATISGLGLTGLITEATLQLKKIPSPYLKVHTHVFHNLQEFISLNAQAEQDHEYTVAWLDCQSSGKHFGRGILIAADFTEERPPNPFNMKSKKVPCFFPATTLNRLSTKCFNHLYFKKGKFKAKNTPSIEHMTPFFFPLDKVKNWNRIYGKRGFLQYQFVVPSDSGLKVIQSILKKIAASRQIAFLSVLKSFGDMTSSGMLSFPMPGLTLALDFPNRGDKTLKLLTALDDVVVAVGGRVYPAKDARMSPEHFKRYYPHWESFAKHIDPAMTSSLWRRVMGEPT
jgi:FAD/FMN-containing dehydrogenase